MSHANPHPPFSASSHGSPDPEIDALKADVTQFHEDYEKFIEDGPDSSSHEGLGDYEKLVHYGQKWRAAHDFFDRAWHLLNKPGLEGKDRDTLSRHMTSLAQRKQQVRDAFMKVNGGYTKGVVKEARLDVHNRDQDSAGWRRERNLLLARSTSPREPDNANLEECGTVVADQDQHVDPASSPFVPIQGSSSHHGNEEDDVTQACAT